MYTCTLLISPPSSLIPCTVTRDKSAIPELKVLLRELRRVANEWEDIGIELDIEEGQLRQINADKGGDSKACLCEMLRIWLSCVAPPPSWSAMADAIDTLGHQDIATQVKVLSLDTTHRNHHINGLSASCGYHIIITCI